MKIFSVNRDFVQGYIIYNLEYWDCYYVLGIQFFFPAYQGLCLEGFHCIYIQLYIPSNSAKLNIPVAVGRISFD